MYFSMSILSDLKDRRKENYRFAPGLLAFQSRQPNRGDQREARGTRGRASDLFSFIQRGRLQREVRGPPRFGNSTSAGPFGLVPLVAAQLLQRIVHLIACCVPGSVKSLIGTPSCKKEAKGLQREVRGARNTSGKLWPLFWHKAFRPIRSNTKHTLNRIGVTTLQEEVRNISKYDHKWSPFKGPAVFHLILKEAKIRAIWILLCFIFTAVTCYWFSEELLFILVKPFLSLCQSLRISHSSYTVLNAPRADPDLGSINHLLKLAEGDGKTASLCLRPSGFWPKSKERYEADSVSAPQSVNLRTTADEGRDARSFEVEQSFVSPLLVQMDPERAFLRRNGFFSPSIQVPASKEEGESVLRFASGGEQREGPNVFFISTQLTETLNTYITSILILSCVFSAPNVIYQLWCFLIPSCNSTQRKRFNQVCVLSGLAFVCMLSISFAYIMPNIWKFLLNLNLTSTNQFCIQLQPKIYDFIILTMRFLFCSSICSQVPVILIILIESHIISIQNCIKHRGGGFFCSLCIAALITPPDLWCQLVTSCGLYICVELILLYELVRLHYNEIDLTLEQASRLK